MMVRTWLPIFILWSMTLCGSLAQTSSPKELMYQSYISGDMQQWQQALGILKHDRELRPSFSACMDEALALYGFAGYCIEHHQSDSARLYVDAGWKLIDRMLEMESESGDLYALRGAYYELELALSSMSVPYYGYRLVAMSRQSMEKTPVSAYCMAERGLYLWHAPSWVGGDKMEAISKYEKAVQMMETAKRSRSWYYLHTITLLARAYEKTAQPQKARAIYMKIIQQEPNYRRVTEELYPRFVQKYGE